jgi:activator of HSP90 ATPase
VSQLPSLSAIVMHASRSSSARVAKQFTAFSGAPAEIDREPGGTFSLFGGLIVGRNVELIPKERIVQAWRPADWEAGVYTLVRFELK